MCKWGTDTVLCVPIPEELSHTGEFRWDWKCVDSCIAPIVDALNKSGIYTASCCCGHGNGDGIIALHDGRELIVRSAAPRAPVNEEIETLARTDEVTRLAIALYYWLDDYVTRVAIADELEAALKVSDA